ncbi:hypothetical protein QTH90_28890 [Variovorax sp. J2P1-59]|uniref:hypothetical protein n=1 Tax=Variovorax flavidus TaxID=3053501 RepID=UPI002577B702|nr:hypothetical protein [Variovorax sp. J2P1-59]MDM0078455.1 hypothetical protein [Variovorax sp. J2P1-59]
MRVVPISKILATTAAAWMLAGGAVAQSPAGRSRADVEAEAIAAAHAPNQNVTRGSRGAEPFTSVADPAKVQQDAIDTAHAPNQNVTRGSRGAEPFTSTADPDAVRAQAEAAAAAPDQNVTSGSRVNSKVISSMPNPVQMRADAKRSTSN